MMLAKYSNLSALAWTARDLLFRMANEEMGFDVG